ncbi:MAG: TonB-dependent receptor plug domain-containing protein, partial [Rhodospirillaceae bacterium]|nr:TonB-dependent receptor plug domain-containing protein [Rhodospirillaceae bacterium]
MTERRLPVIWIALAPMTAAVQAQPPEAARAQIAEEVAVIGTRRGAQSTERLAVPVDVLDAERLGGQGDMLDVLTARMPSYNVNREAITGAATLMRPANLRGLPAGSTLVLVNGKRRHRGAVISEFASGVNKGAQGVDLVPLIPIALQRVEILRDGASAQYGSDAIAGVMNFVLEDDPDVRRLQLQYGSTYVGDGDQLSASGAFGTRLGSDGFVTVSMELKDSEPTSRGSQDPQATRLIDNGYTGVADPVVIWGAPEVKNDFKVILNGAVEAGIGELYGFGGWSGREVDGSFFYRNPNGRRGVFLGADANLLVADLTPEDDAACRTV